METQRTVSKYDLATSILGQLQGINSHIRWPDSMVTTGLCFLRVTTQRQNYKPTQCHPRVLLTYISMKASLHFLAISANVAQVVLQLNHDKMHGLFSPTFISVYSIPFIKNLDLVLKFSWISLALLSSLQKCGTAGLWNAKTPGFSSSLRIPALHISEVWSAIYGGPLLTAFMLMLVRIKMLLRS